MENWIKRIFLVPHLTVLVVVGLLGASTTLVAQTYEQASERPLIAPDVRPKKVQESLIDSENFEVGFYAGYLSIEDFESAPLVGARVALHLSELLFLEANYAQSEAGDTSFEKLTAGIRLLSDEEREYRYYNVSLGYNFLPGEGFLDLPFTNVNFAYNTNFYFVGGLGATDFAGDSETTVNFGWGYQILFNDWFSWHFVARQHLFSNELLGEEKRNFNPEFSSGFAVFF